MIKYDLNRLSEWVFYVNSPFIIPHEHISHNDNLSLEEGDYFTINREEKILYPGLNDKTIHAINILNKNINIGITIDSTIQTILHNSTLNKGHKCAFFSECKEMYERNKTIDSILEKN
tara:strand:+ start:3620 stop:3973 length:354 start_codon:yes stop_codon:yes gene_type:complete